MMKRSEKSAESGFIEILSQSGIFSYLDIHFARLVCRLADEKHSWPLFLAALLAGYVVNERRQICLDLRSLPDDLATWLEAGDETEIKDADAVSPAGLPWPELWEEQLKVSAAVALPDAADSRRKLLVLDDGRLYLQRYWDYEQRLAQMIGARLQFAPLSLTGMTRTLAEVAPRFVVSQGEKYPDYQAAAVLAALRNHFTIISGGPGCGKTSIVAALAALCSELWPQIRIALCAPTGRAQARLSTALREEAEFLNPAAGVKEKLEKLESATIHRLLGYRPGRGFRYHQDNRLPLDLLIIDEASMVPLTLMTNLLAALPDECRVVLLGDRHQLASVEAGAVLGDLSSSGAENIFSESFIAELAHLTGNSDPAAQNIGGQPDSQSSLFRDHVVELKKSYRFASGCGIARLQQAIMAPAPEVKERLAEVFADDPSGEVSVSYISGAGETELGVRLREIEIDFGGQRVPFRSYLEADELADAFSMFASFRLLAPLRHGPFGVENLNRLMTRAVGGPGFGPGFRGYPVMIARNAPRLNLYNGDTGLVWPDSEGRMMVWFKRADGSFAGFTPLQLPAHECTFATTVHKAQGSGFQRVVLFWPGGDSALLTREMLYTGITRAARRLEIWLPETVSLNSLAAACAVQVKRSSGLLQALKRMA